MHFPDDGTKAETGLERGPRSRSLRRQSQGWNSVGHLTLKPTILIRKLSASHRAHASATVL